MSSNDDTAAGEAVKTPDDFYVEVTEALNAGAIEPLIELLRSPVVIRQDLRDFLADVLDPGVDTAYHLVTHRRRTGPHEVPHGMLAGICFLNRIGEFGDLRSAANSRKIKTQIKIEVAREFGMSVRRLDDEIAALRKAKRIWEAEDSAE